MGSSWQVRVGVVVVVMLSKWPEILEREDEVLIVGLGFLETPRALLVLVFMSIYGIGSSVCQNYSDLELSSFRGKKAFTERMKPTTYAATKKNILINHLNSQNPKSQKKKNLYSIKMESRQNRTKSQPIRNSKPRILHRKNPN